MRCRPRALDRNVKKFPKAKLYADFRKMLETQKDIDAVVVATPDHLHAPVSIMAMKMGKHVHCQKPLTHSVYEARLMGNIAIRTKEKLLWDGENQRFTNSEEANKLINPPYREGWSL